MPSKGTRKPKSTTFNTKRNKQLGISQDFSSVNELFKRRCENDLIFLARDVLGYQYDPYRRQGFCDPPDFIHRRIIETLNAPTRFKAIFVPRGTYKTTLITICYTIQRLLKNPNMTILIANQVWNNARAFLRAIKIHLENNEKLIEAYGNFKSTVWTRDWIDIAQRTSLTNAKQPSINTAGLETAITSQHPDLLILDDIGGPENITTSEQKQKVIDFIDRAIPLVGKQGEVIMVGTFWAHDDWYAYAKEKWLPQKDWDGRDLFTVLEMGIVDENGDPVHPSVHDLQTIEVLKETMDSFTFACQYMLNPVQEGNTLFKKEDVRLYQNLEKEDYEVYITLDPAISLDRKKCWTGIVCGVPVHPNKLYIDNALRIKVLPSELIDRILGLLDSYRDENGKTRVKAIGVEDAAFQKIYNGSIINELRNRNIYNIPVIPLKPVGSKDGRILELEPYFRHGQIYVKQELKDLLDQLYRYPHIGVFNRDLLDALAYQLQVLPGWLFYNPYGIIKSGEKNRPSIKLSPDKYDVEVEEAEMLLMRGAELW